MTIDATLPDTTLPTTTLSGTAPTTAEIMAAHVGGKLATGLTAPLRDDRDLAISYTPGVAQVSRAIAADARARRPLHLGAPPGRRGQRRHRRARPRRHRPAGRAAGDGGQVRAVQDLRRARLDPAGARHHGRRRDRRDPRAAAAQLRRGQPGRRVGAAVLRAGAPADRGARLPGHARRPARHRDRPARRAARGVRGRRPRPGRAADRDLRSRRGRRGLRADPARRRGHGRRRARLPRRAGPRPRRA